MNPDIRQEIETFLSTQRTMVLATADADGVPMAHGMHYYPTGLRLYVSSLPHTRKLANVEANPVVGYTVWRLASYDKRDSTRTLQVKAAASVITDEVDVEAVQHGLTERYPWAEELQLDSNVVLALDPIELLWMDISKGLEGRLVHSFQ